MKSPDENALTGSWAPAVVGKGRVPAPTDSHGAPAAPGAPPGYEILGELGRGGMGVVYKARQVRLDRLVALKMILAGGHAGAAELARFRAEAQAIARLRHPNVVQVYEVGEHEGLPFFSLEYVEGGSLADRLDGTPQPAPAAAALVETLARAVHAAHEQAVVHRDLKPANILLRQKSEIGNPNPGARAVSELEISGLGFPSDLGFRISGLDPFITDFGLAKRLGDATGQTATGAILGTPSYMAPEQAGGGGKAAGPAADIYALGAILYELLTGRPPFKAATPLDTVLQVVNEDPVPPSRLNSRVPRDLETVAAKCLQKEPAKRYGSALELADDLARFLAGEPVRARAVGPWERAVKWARRRPAVAALIAVCAAAVLGFLGVVLAYNARLQRSNAELQDALERAGRERQRADDHRHKAMEVVERVLNQATDENAAHRPLLEQQRQLQDVAQGYYDWLIRLESDDPTVRRQTARAVYWAGAFHVVLGEGAEGRKACEAAAAMQEKLAAEFPDEPDYRHDLARTRLTLAFAHTSCGAFEPAGASYNLALGLSRRLVAQHPGRADFQETLVTVTCYAGYSLMFARQRDQAIGLLGEAVRNAESLAQRQPASRDCQCLLANTYAYLAEVHLNFGQNGPAEEAVRRALERLEPADRPPPTGGKDHQRAWAITRAVQAQLRSRNGQLEQAREYAADAVGRYQRLLEPYPKHFPYRFQLMTAYRLLAEICDRLGQAGPADDAWQRAVSEVERMSRDYPEFRWLGYYRDEMLVGRVVGWARRGDLGRALPHADEWAARPDLPGTLYYNLACAYALTASASEGQQADEYARRALDLLVRSEAGYLQALPAIEHARKDDDLKVLWPRSEFQELLDRLEAKAKETR
jgi:serine/threonine protein kinase